MYRSYQTALHLFKPDAVFILGDLLDEGKWANDKQWKRYVASAKNVFQTSQNVNFHAIIGNHDVGFHYSITQHKLKRYLKYYL